MAGPLAEGRLGFPSLRVFVPGRAWKHHLLLRHSSASTHGAFNSSGRSPEIPIPVGDLLRARRNDAARALSPAPNRFKRMGWTIPFQLLPAAKCEVPRAEPGGVTLAGQGRATWREAAFLWVLPKSPSSFPPRYSLGIWHPPHRIFSWDPAALQHHHPQEVLLGSGIPTASFPQVILLEYVIPAATFPSKYSPGISAPHPAPSPVVVPTVRQQPWLRTGMATLGHCVKHPRGCFG